MSDIGMFDEVDLPGELATEEEIAEFNNFLRSEGFEDSPVTIEDEVTSKELQERREFGEQIKQELIGALADDVPNAELLEKLEEKKIWELTSAEAPEVTETAEVTETETEKVGETPMLLIPASAGFGGADMVPMLMPEPDGEVDEIIEVSAPPREELEAWLESLPVATAAIPETPKSKYEDSVPAKDRDGSRLLPNVAIQAAYKMRYDYKDGEKQPSYNKIRTMFITDYGVAVSGDLVRSIVLGLIYRDQVDASPYAEKIRKAAATSSRVSS